MYVLSPCSDSRKPQFFSKKKKKMDDMTILSSFTTPYNLYDQNLGVLRFTYSSTLGKMMYSHKKKNTTR